MGGLMMGLMTGLMKRLMGRVWGGAGGVGCTRRGGVQGLLGGGCRLGLGVRCSDSPRTGVCRRRKRESNRDSLESFHGVETVSLWRDSMSGSRGGAVCASLARWVARSPKGSGHVVLLGGVPLVELEGLLDWLRYPVNWGGFRCRTTLREVVAADIWRAGTTLREVIAGGIWRARRSAPVLGLDRDGDGLRSISSWVSFGGRMAAVWSDCCALLGVASTSALDVEGRFGVDEAQIDVSRLDGSAEG